MAMPLILDTHIFIWLMEGSSELSARELKSIKQYSKKEQLLISPISVWEIANLEKSNRITLKQPTLQWIEEALASPAIILAPLTPTILCESVALPGDFHKDPADRMIVATARIMNACLMTRDKKILDYAEQGLVDCV